MSSEPAQEVRLRDRVEWSAVHDQLVAFDPTTGAGVTINRTGSALWPALLAGSTEHGLADVLEARYNLTRAQAERDVEEFLVGLRKRDLLEEAPR